MTLWLRCCNCDWDLRCSLRCLLYVLVICWYLLIQTWKDDCWSRWHQSSWHVSLYHLVMILSMFIKTHVFYFKDCQSDLPNSQPSGFPGGGGSFRELWHTGLADVGMPMSPGQMCCRCSSWNNIWLVKFCEMRAFSGILDTKFRTCSLFSVSSLAMLSCRGDTRELFFDRSKLHPRGMDQVQNLGRGHQILRNDKLPKFLQPLAPCITKLVWNVKALAMEISTTILCRQEMFSSEIPVPVAVSGCPPLWCCYTFEMFFEISQRKFLGTNLGPQFGFWIFVCSVFFLKTVQIWQKKSRHQIRKFHSNFRWTVANGAIFHAFHM